MTARTRLPSAARIKAVVSPLDFYRGELPDMPVPKRARGWVLAGRNPMREDRRPGSFRVNLDTGAFVDFSDGTRGGDVIAWMQIRHGLSFPDALAELAGKWGVRP